MRRSRPSRPIGRIAFAASTSALSLVVAGTPVGAQQARVTVDQQPVSFAKVGPQVEASGRVLVPLRGVFEKMGATVDYHQGNRTVKATRGDTTMLLTVGSGKARVNGRDMTLDAPVGLYHGSVLVPLRVISENLGADVQWNRASRTVAIDTGHRAATSSTSEENASSVAPSTESTSTMTPGASAPGTTESAAAPNMSQPPGPAGAAVTAPETTAPTGSERVPITPMVVEPQVETNPGFDWTRWAPWIVGAVLLLGLLAYLALRGRGGSVIAARNDRGRI